MVSVRTVWAELARVIEFQAYCPVTHPEAGRGAGHGGAGC